MFSQHVFLNMLFHIDINTRSTRRDKYLKIFYQLKVLYIATRMQTIDPLHLKIYYHCVYHNPASKHYPTNFNAIVFCDRCKRSHLEVCIGYENNLDLCLDCIKEIALTIKQHISAYSFFKH